MLALLLVSTPIALLNELNGLAALLLVKGQASPSVMDQPTRNALAMFFLHLRANGFNIAGVFWGLWLFPMGMLVFRSGFFPRLLGIAVVLGCFAYLTNSFMGTLFPLQQAAVARWTGPLEIVEMVFVIWLIINGVNPVSSPSSRSFTSER